MIESTTENSQVLSDVLEQNSSLAPGEIVLGVFSAIDSNGNALVSYPQSGFGARVAISTLPLSHQLIGRQVALLFSNGDLQKPIIIGFIHSALNDLLENFVLTPTEPNDDITVFETPLEQPNIQSSTETLHVDGKRIVFEGQEEIVLQCGEASITLTKAGKIMIRGKYLVSRSSGVNRILGGSVQVN